MFYWVYGFNWSFDCYQVYFQFVFENVGGLEILAVGDSFSLKYLKNCFPRIWGFGEIGQEFVWKFEEKLSLDFVVFGLKFAVQDFDQLEESGSVDVGGVDAWQLLM